MYEKVDVNYIHNNSYPGPSIHSFLCMDFREKIMEQYILQLGALGIIFALAIREFFAYLKSKKENGVGGKLDLIRGNDLTHILAAIQDQTKTNHEDHTSQITVLTEIATILKERR